MKNPKVFYFEFNEMINRENQGLGIEIPIYQFVTLFNRHSSFWLKNKIKKLENENSLDELQELLVLNFPLTFNKFNEKSVSYNVPDDFFSSSRLKSSCKVSKESCEKIIDVEIIDFRNIEQYSKNSSLSPSFEFEETYGVINNQMLDVYVDNFEILQAYLSYYKKIDEIDVEGYIKSDGTESKNKYVYISDLFVYEIFDLMLIEVFSMTEDQFRFQAKSRQASIEN